MKTLIVYYSFTGNNKKLAEHLQGKTNADVFGVRTKRKVGYFSIMIDLLFNRKPKLEDCLLDLKSYDCIILSSPVWARKIPPPLKGFLLKEKDNINKYAFISVCGGGQKEKLLKQLNSILNKSPIAIEELVPKGIFEKMKYEVTETDFEILKEQIDGFVEQIK